MSDGTERLSLQPLAYIVGSRFHNNILLRRKGVSGAVMKLYTNRP